MNYRLLPAILLFSSLTASAVQAQGPEVIPITNANCVAVDGLGRALPSYQQTGPTIKDRWVGIFYWQWHGDLRAWSSYNITEWLKTHPGFKDWVSHPEGGPDFPTWYWAEPLFGYYRSTDPWVMRKHMAMLADAGVDFLYLDYTNDSVYDQELQQLIDVLHELKANGMKVPKLVFFLNHDPEWKVEHLYTNWYTTGKADDLWFKWNGKPLIMAPIPTDPAALKNPHQIPPDTTPVKDASVIKRLQDYFTYRPTWAFQDAKTDPTKWRFMDNNPQRPALDANGKVEQMVVAKSLGGPLWENMHTSGVSCVPGFEPKYDDQWTSKENAQGLFHQYQWDQAMKVKAPMLLVTGWNEWTASVWETETVKFLGRVTGKGQGHIVDEFNQDFNRDLEPMKGGYGDVYYWQFVANMRKYKGMDAPQPVSAPRKVTLGQSASWAGVTPVYNDTVKDTANRSWAGTPKGVFYTNNTSRNGIIAAQVARDTKNISFCVRTSQMLTAPAGSNWMVLLIDKDNNPKTGWNGYDLMINRSRKNGKASIEKCVGNKWAWTTIGSAAMSIGKTQLELQFPRSLICAGKLAFGFKWMDNQPTQPSIESFYTDGDVAPNSRYNYLFKE